LIDDHLQLKVKKQDKVKWATVLYAPLKLDEENETITVDTPPLNEEIELWFQEIIQPELIQYHRQFEERVENFEDKIVGKYTEEVNLEEFDQTLSEEELADQIYKRAVELLDEQSPEAFKLFKKAASLNHGAAKEQCLVLEAKILEKAGDEATKKIMMAESDEEHDSVVKQFREEQKLRHETIMSYVASAAHVNKLPTSIIRLATDLQDSREYDKAIIYYAEAALHGYTIAMSSIAIMYYLGSTNFPKNDEKAAAWWKLALNRGLASAAYNLALLYGVDSDDLDLAYDYALVSKYIDPTYTIPDRLENKIKKRNEPVQEERKEQSAPATKFDFSKALSGTSPNPFMNLHDDDLLNLEEEEEEEEGEEVDSQPDVPGVKWSVSEWVLTGSILAGISYFMWTKVRVHID
jgi:hypothetical protein